MQRHVPRPWTRPRRSRRASTHANDRRTIVITRPAHDRLAVRGQYIREREIEDAPHLRLRRLSLLQPRGTNIVRPDESHRSHQRLPEKAEIRIGRGPVLKTI